MRSMRRFDNRQIEKRATPFAIYTAILTFYQRLEKRPIALGIFSAIVVYIPLLTFEVVYFLPQIGKVPIILWLMPLGFGAWISVTTHSRIIRQRGRPLVQADPDATSKF